jgi:hypothetical protein
MILDIMDNETPDSNPIEITNAELLGKLRSIKGQYSHQNNPVYYFDNAPIKY